MFGVCRGSLWRRDDFTACFRHDYLQTIFPLILCAVSILYLVLQALLAWRTNRSHAGYKKLAQALPNGDYVPPDPSRFIDDPDEDESTQDTDVDDDDYEANEYIALARTRTHDSVIETNHPRGEIWLVLLEELAVLGQFGIHLAILLLNTWGSRGRVAAITELATWTYVTILASLRLLLSSQSRFSWSKIWYHTAFIYCLVWCFNTLIFRSEILHPRSKISRNLSIVDFTLTSVLAVIAITSRKGNRAVKLEYEGSIEPSKEQTASLLSLASFSWVDRLIWRGYKKPLEMTDVWNLTPSDKAANILAHYRQVQKTSKLAYHLLHFFRRGLIIQALWAGITGLLTFAPTILLKVILEYVENPSATPRNAAWFYVILLPVSGAIKAVADGQALYLGRRICIRLRAIIIGEIYAKALKRKAGSSAEKVLGGVDKKDQNRPKGFFKRVFGKRNKDEQNSQANDQVTLEADQNTEGQVTTGTIINLMAIDSYKVSEISAYLHFLWASTPVQFVGTIVLLYGVLGFSSFVGIVMMALLLPINLWLSNQFAKLQKAILAATDQRIHITNEVLSNIRIIKFFAWEQRFMAMVEEKRHLELKRLFHRYMIWAFAATIWSGSPIVITLLTFLVYTRIEHKDLLPSIAFTALSLFQILRIPLDQVADMIARVQESKVSVDRVEEYLNEPETDKFNQLKHQVYDENGHPLIGFDGGTFSWGVKGDLETEAFRLLELDLHFAVDKLNVIVGPTGSGKTSILMALLGEMTLLEGLVHLPGVRSREDLRPSPDTGLIESVAYCAQQAWLVNASIKENIVFASPWNPDRYKEVIIACSLQRDLEILDAGDETLVGEKGVTLSGGQKQRISLARALYSQARHILLDDILSAVDAHTAKWIFEKAIQGPLMANRTCILVTHNVALSIPHADFAVVLENGRVVAKGTANEVARSGKLSEDTSKSLNTSRGPSRTHSRAPSEDGDSTETAVNKVLGEETTINTGKAVQGDEEETKAVGSVKLSVMLLYLAAMGSWLFWTMAGIVFVAQQLVSVASNVWIREWANAYADREGKVRTESHGTSITHVTGISGCFTRGICGWSMPFSNSKSARISASEEFAPVNDWYYAGVYTAIGLVLVVSVFLREWVLFYGSITASRRIHTRLMESVTRAKFRFFDSTPLGQIMNRFSKDIEGIDQDLTPVAIGVVFCLLSILTIIVLITIITPGFLIAAAGITVLYFITGMLYIHASRDLKRLESVKRSPLYQQFGETLTGMTTIRAYCDERRFIRENIAKINVQNRPFIFLWASNRWLAFRIDIIGSLVSFFSAAFVIMSVGKIDAGAAGLAMTYALTYSENMLWFVRLYAMNEQYMNSVERIKEYLDVEQEAAPIVEDKRPPGNWPSKGSVEFVNYSTRYRAEFDMVLKKVSFKVLPGEKVGVVGRTGAGKSSMALALFRALEAEEGKIIVDDVDIGEIGLQDLREKLVMVPQDPTLFSGTIRSNLDPFGLFTDEEIFTSLRRVQLIGSPGPSSSTTPNRPSTPENQDSPSGALPSVVISDSSQQLSESTVVPSSAATTVGEESPRSAVLENKNIFVNLSSPISESGSNLSQGQRQLLCLARAMLKEPAVLLMDEATASIDHATDAKIQETIRTLKNTTITIAHRLKTIVDYDKVLVLDQGQVMEYGTPWDLLDKEDGLFRGMCEGSGEMEVLKNMARAAKEERKDATS